MKSVFLFKKSLLALTIGALAQQAFAFGYNIANGSENFPNQTFNGPFQLVGSRNTVLSSNDPGVQISDSAINGDFINNSSLALDANGLRANGIGIGIGIQQSFAPARQSTINGSVINNGTLDIHNAGDVEGFEIGHSTVSGSVINNGKILLSMASTFNGFGSPEAMYLHGAQIGGDVINRGTIRAIGDYATGLIFDADGPNKISIGGKIINTQKKGDRFISRTRIAV